MWHFALMPIGEAVDEKRWERLGDEYERCVGNNA